ncbi:MAG: hypothetical protein JO083_02250 [Candidatus Eremiobacteraeota bacterium]|nr:hypothetical protein [Candidatus Eremiobacteraeota bacterium]
MLSPVAIERITYVLLYGTLAMSVPCLLYLLLTLPHRLKQALRAEPPQRRATDFKTETSE